MAAAVLRLGQVRGVRRHHRGVVGAEDVDGDRGGGAVAAEHAEAVGIGGAGGELVVGAGRRCRSRRRWRRSRTCRSDAGGVVWVWKRRRAVDVADGQRAGGGDVGGGVGLGQVADVSGHTAPSLVPRMLMVTEVAVPSLLSTREAVGIGDAGGELVVCAGRRCRSRRRWRRSRTCRRGRRCRSGSGSVAALSTSLMVSVPEVLMSAAVSLLGQVLWSATTPRRRRWCRGC